MIICGYPGIGKSTYAKNHFAIDLDSSIFKYPNGEKPENWFKLYVNAAKSIAEQKYLVFISSHPEVIRELVDRYILAAVCYPVSYLEADWTAKLKERYDKTEKCDVNKAENNYRAWKKVESGFQDQIDVLQKAPLFQLPIYSMTYDLGKLVDQYSNYYISRN